MTADREATRQTFSEYLHETSEKGEIRVGLPLPLGAHAKGNGVNFAIFSRHATGVRLLFFEDARDTSSSREITLDPVCNRTGDVWHVWVQGVRPGQLYGYRVEGPYHPQHGHRFNAHKLLLDPMATAITYREDWDFETALGYVPEDARQDNSFSEMDDAGDMPKCIFAGEYFDWEGDTPLNHSLEESVIYETHVRGLTIHESSEAAHPGTYRGVVEKIPYFKKLGITALELMPVQEFNENELKRINPLTGAALKNYWGYNPVAFLAPESSYCSRGTVGHQLLEFQEMVKALHQAGIEVILDVVFNHTAEGNELGPTLCFRGIDNVIYYLLEEDPRFYKDYTGTGNTIKADHPVVRDFILTALRHWVLEMHVDGFRFDLASVLGRDEAGNVQADAPLLERIAEDPILRQTKIIAEAWDAAGAYQVGSFSEHRWAEWNGRYRDDVRGFWRGDAGMVGAFAQRITGSADLYQGFGKGPERSINFVTCHDGFTLNDLVSYARKHNEVNGESNRDGADENYSANYGIEGKTDDAEIQAIRVRQIKNFLLTLFIARGVPMLLGGDEFRRTQQGNNNAYCQDNEISWYDWGYLEEHEEIFRFTCGMIALRHAHPVLRQPVFYTEDDLHWFGPEGNTPAWDDPHVRYVACAIQGQDGPDICLLFNAATETVTFALPALGGDKSWRLAVDTFATMPEDMYARGEEPSLEDPTVYRMRPRSSVILLAL